jgi:hypothetical protein
MDGLQPENSKKSPHWQNFYLSTPLQPSISNLIPQGGTNRKPSSRIKNSPLIPKYLLTLELQTARNNQPITNIV